MQFEGREAYTIIRRFHDLYEFGALKRKAFEMCRFLRGVNEVEP